MEVDAENIIIGAGTEYLYSIIVQLLGRDSVIAVEDPGYRKIGKVYESNGVECLHLPIDNSGIQTKALLGKRLMQYIFLHLIIFQQVELCLYQEDSI